MPDDRPARVPPHPRTAGGLAIVGIVLLLVAAVVAALQWRQLGIAQQAVRVGNPYAGMGLFQVEVAFLRLAGPWRAAAAGDAEAAAALPLRYELFVSQLATARKGGLREIIDGVAEAEAARARLEAFVSRADALFDAGRAPSPEALTALLVELDEVDASARTLTLAAAHRSAERGDALVDTLRRYGSFGVALGAALLLLCAAFALLALRQHRLVRERQRALEALAERLTTARRDAEAADQAKTAFLADTSHELRTPVQGLLGMLTLLAGQRASLQPRQAEQLQLALDAGQHLLRILDDLLDLSRLQSGSLVLQRAPLALQALADEVLALMRPQAAAKGLLLQSGIEPGLPQRIVADGTRVRQVLFNLLSNAVRHCDRGSVTLDLRRAPGDPARLQFLVTDTGIGIGRDDARRLLDGRGAGHAGEESRAGHAGVETRSGHAGGLTRAGHVGADERAGAGLGLDISRRLARLMGGELTLHSVPGEGSRFGLEIPLQEAAPEPAAAPAPPASPLEAELRTLAVLVAEDHPINRQYLAALLESLGHRAHFVADGRDAVRAACEQRFDLVLMDLHMPEMDGIAATRAIRALPDRAAATVPIVALTADAFQETRERCLVAGMNDFLTKPVSPQDLAAALRRLFGHDAADAAPPGEPPAPAPLAPSAALVDAEALQRLLQGLPAGRVAELVNAYLDQAGDTAARMRQALREGRALELRALAHATRGAALNLGLSALAQTAQALHEGAAHLPAHEVAHLVQRFERLLPRTREAAQEVGLPA